MICDHFYCGQKTVATLCQSLDKARARCGVTQDLTEFIDDGI